MTSPKPTLADIDLPAICGPITDLAAQRPCRRAVMAYRYQSWAANIARELRRLDRLRNPHRRAKLTRECAEEIERLTRYLRLFTGYNMPCTHPEGERRTITNPEDAITDGTGRAS